MTEARIVSIAAVEEPRKDIAPKGGDPVGVQLNFELTGIAEGDDPRALFETFLAARKSVRFASYTLDGGGAKLLLDKGWLDAIGATPAGADDAVSAWLAQPAGGSIPPVWVNKDNHSEGEIAGRAASLSAGQRLAGAQTWPGPLPQKAGLTRLVELPDKLAPGLYVVADLADDGTPPPAEIALDVGPDKAGVVEIVRAAGPLGNVSMRVAPTDLLSADLLLIDRATGFLALDRDNFALVELIRYIRDRAGSLVWTAPHLIGATGAPTDERRGQALVWRAVMTLCASLDTLMLAMAMPGVVEREGPIIGAVLAQASDPTAPPDPSAERAYAAEIRAWVRDSAQLATSNAAEFARLLAALLARPTLTELVEKKTPLVDGHGNVIDTIGGYAELLPALLQLFCTAPKAPWPASINLDDIEARVDKELAACVALMGTETGFEAAVIAALRFKKGALTTLVGGDADRAEHILLAIAATYDAGYNALEAARKAVGSLFADTLLREKPGSSPDSIEASLLASDWFANRIRWTPTSKLFDAFYSVLPRTQEADAESLAAIVAVLEPAFVEVCADIGAGASGTRRRFVPDTVPRDIEIQLPVDLVASEDNFGKAYDGLAVLAKLDGAEQWAQVNLAHLDAGAGSARIEEPLAILPMQPTQSDGEAQLSHRFDGRPFALARPATTGGEASFPSYFRVDSPDTLTDPWPAGFAKIPALAYGRSLDIAAYAASRNGVLPKGASKPAALGTDYYLYPSEAPDPGAQFVPYVYSRTTGVGRVAIERVKPASGPDAFTAPINQIQPLSSDYPRLALSLPGPGKRLLDLWRQADGFGAMSPPPIGESISLSLGDFRFSGSAVLEVSIVTDPRGLETGTAVSLVSGDLTPGDPLGLLVEADGKNCSLTINGTVKRFPVSPDEHFWIRLALVSQDAGASAIAFADVRGAVAGKTAGTIGAQELLVLRPNEPGWREDVFAADATCSVLPPSMGIEDFDRWLANPLLYKAQVVPGPVDRVAQLQQELIAMTEHLAATSPQEFAKDSDAQSYARALENNAGFLPDLAVDSVIVELTLVDALDNTPWARPTLSQRVKLPLLGKLLEDINYKPDQPELSFRALAQLRRISVTIEPTTDEAIGLSVSGGVITVKIPVGSAARLAIRPAIPEAHFDGKEPVIDQRLLQHSTGSMVDGSLVIFEGAGLTIETMKAHSADDEDLVVPLIAQCLNLTAAEGSRTYRLEVDPRGNAWRHVGTADVATQRWRSLGRPIYNWFSPRRNKHRRNEGSGTIVRLAGSSLVGVFDAQAFDSDVAQRARVRMQPLGTTSLVHTGSWEAPSATLFRHRLTLRGRYADALKSDKKACWTVIGENAARPRADREAWLRVAVLASSSMIELARPQLRAMMPLNRAIDEGGPPPVLAMMSEPPFPQGGLADRLAASVTLGIGYEMQGTEADQTLGVRDVRQEAGKDPQLTYSALTDDVVQRLCLEAQGPIGLTFDDAGTSSAFANSAWTLSPALLGDARDYEDWEEHFLNVSMRRYLDPEWLAQPTSHDTFAPAPSTVGFGETRWIELADTGKFSCGGTPIVSIDKTGTTWKIEVDSKAILREQSHPGPALTAWQFDDASVTAIALLHQPLDVNRAALTIFAIRSQASAPSTLGTILWQANAVPAPGIDLTVGGVPAGGASKKALIAPTAASAPTAGQWVRTGRDFDQVAGTTLPGTGGSARYRATSLKVVRDATGVAGFQTASGNKLWLRPTGHDSLPMLSLQRFLAVLHTDVAAGNGRLVEEFDNKTGAALLVAPTMSVASTDTRHRTRVIELESPAKSLTARPKDLPREYQLTQFDLKETRQEAAQTFILLVKPYSDARKRTNYVLDLTLTTPAHETKFSFAISKSAAQQIVIVQSDDVAKGWAIDATGAVIDAKITPSAIPSPVPLVSITANTQDDWWADVSLLARATALPADVTPTTLPFDFDWLFGENDNALETALGHAALRDLGGAQARIIAVSPAIEQAEPDSPTIMLAAEPAAPSDTEVE